MQNMSDNFCRHELVGIVLIGRCKTGFRTVNEVPLTPYRGLLNRDKCARRSTLPGACDDRSCLIHVETGPFYPIVIWAINVICILNRRSADGPCRDADEPRG